ncbi:MAG: hypothetical protein RLZ98_232 [Pseudomonadota bacterium]
MADLPNMEIPGAVREMAEKNLDQMRSAYEQFMDMTRKSQEMVAQSQGAMTQSALEIQARAMRFAQENMESGFKLAGELARARDVKEYLDIQTRHAQRQMQTYAEQAQELGRMMAEAAQKAQPKG